MADPKSSVALPAHALPDASSGALPGGAPRSGVLHVRHRHTDRFTVVGNHLAQHPRLSAAAIGIGVHLQSLPDGASATVKTLTLRFREGETTIRRALNELEEAGYLERRRVPLGGGRVATRTVFHDNPGCVRKPQHPKRLPPAPPTPLQPCPVDAPTEAPPDVPPTEAPQHPRQPPPNPAQGPAPDLLARLRLADPRLLLSTHDVRRLTPAVDAWLTRAATPAQITHTLTANLPPARVPIHHPARFLEHRLTTHLPPLLPRSQPAVIPPPAAPLHTCDGCDRAFRTHDPTGLCRDCRSATLAA
ncbi:helix-turn-helix domain-containing protein [Streptomyces flavofungini]|uniref:Helix-turn-helix domain-containing protein n=1 Tax=Streptomyces flavofungini TaxID=68200 RepID=A0ABS0XEF1_9ACTN|nr:helix-turn-helix domain-containing protein [Streptomyces flavofungini]MBJ3811396.1 helix-turn-helix domain-containing protein [Streptomyces flavofungini]GHC42613.1 DNA-binding protein [Streptomyces flavofungini]